MIADGDCAGFQVMLAASAIDSAVPDCGTESERSGGSAQSEKELRGIERFQLVGLLKPAFPWQPEPKNIATRSVARSPAVADGGAMHAVLAGEGVDLIVLDLKLLGEDGMTLARRLRERSAIPIVMLTGRRDEADRVMGLGSGRAETLPTAVCLLSRPTHADIQTSLLPGGGVGQMSWYDSLAPC